jgi:hypothetical protein
VSERVDQDTAAAIGAKDIATGVVLLVFAWTLVRDVRVPLLSLVDLGFHELGHLVTMWLPELVMMMAGSIVQVAVPLGLAVYFVVGHPDRHGTALCAGWAATAAADGARYVADAPYERLPLIGGDHDWAFVLHHFDLLGRAELFANLVRVFAWGLLAAAVAWLCWPWIERLLTGSDPTLSS